MATGEQKPITIGRYVLRRRLGEGVVGSVWLGHDPSAQRDVAIKVMLPTHAQNERVVKRFVREAQLAAKIKHPNVVEIYEIGGAGAAIFIVMEWVDGGNLTDYLDEHGTMPWRDAGRAIRGAAAGLGAAHELNVIHRDIKPQNLMRTSQGVIKVVDFGLARCYDQPSDITVAGSLVGSPSYMSPEQCAGLTLDARSDIYSLVCTFYELLTGETPFGNKNMLDIIHRHQSETFPDVNTVIPGLPPAIGEILQRGTQKAPGDRFQTMTELMTALDTVLTAETSQAAAAS